MTYGESGSCGSLNTEDYYDLLREQHENDVVLVLSQIDATDPGRDEGND